MKTNLLRIEQNHRNGCHYALYRTGRTWQVTFAGQQASFQHELGAFYVACLLLEPPPQPMHALGLALNARGTGGWEPSSEGDLGALGLGTGDQMAVRALWCRQRELERVLEDPLQTEPVKSHARRALEDITNFLSEAPWLSNYRRERCVLGVAAAIHGFHSRLVGAVNAEGTPDTVLRALGEHLREHLLIPSVRCGGPRAGRGVTACFTYHPPAGVVWDGGQKGQGPSAKCQVSGITCQERGAKFGSGCAVGRGSDALGVACACLVLAVLATGCVGTRPLKGGKALIVHGRGGDIEQTLVQGENPAQATRQNQDSVKVRTYTVPAGSRIVSDGTGGKGQVPGVTAGKCQVSGVTSQVGQPSTFNSQPSTVFTLSAPMPVVEREETHTRTELGAAQKDTARELGAKLSSLKGIVWVGVGLFIFGLASLVWPPLKAVIGSVTTSIALALGGVALMVLPSLIVGNELLILGAVGLAVGGWFLAHRHGQLRGMLAGSTAAEARGTK